METGSWNFVGAGNGNGGGRGQNGNCTTSSSSLAWDIWQLGTSSRYDWINTHHPSIITTTSTTTASTPTIGEASPFHALLHHQPPPPPPPPPPPSSISISNNMYVGPGTHYFNPPTDPQLMCLKLGKRHYFEDAIPLGDRNVAAATALSVPKRGRSRMVPYYGYSYGPNYGQSSTVGVTVAAPPPPPPRVPAVVLVPRCQVEGCEAVLLNGKDYHRRHKVCEMHSKAPKVKVHGIEQRFCQQCSRFHEVTEFDDSKRSCRRRLAGHNERRRKTSHDHHSLVRSPQQGSFSSTTGHAALSLLSLKNNDHCRNFSSSDLSSRCSAALRELIAENRAYSSILGGKHQFLLDKDINHHTSIEEREPHQNNASHYNSDLANNHSLHDHDSRSWGCFNKADKECYVRLNLAPASAFELLSMRGKSNNKDAEECSDIWSSLGGTHVV